MGVEHHWIEVATLLVQAIGVPFLIHQVRTVGRSINTQNTQINAQTVGCLYDHYFNLCRTLLDKPHLRSYLYDGRRLDGSADTDERRSEVATACELMTGLLEQAVLQRSNLPKDAWESCWYPYLNAMYRDSDSEMARFFAANAGFYASDFCRIVRPLLGREASAGTAELRSASAAQCPAG